MRHESQRRWALLTTMVLAQLAWSASALGAPGRADYDLDDDGLIEIDDLQDLDAIRYEPFGTMLYGTDVGCDKEGGCRGFELMADLDFDTHCSADPTNEDCQDGVVNEDDDFFAGTSQGTGPGGWTPIEQLLAPFEGNHHTIRNLTLIGVWPRVTPGGEVITTNFNPPLPGGDLSTYGGGLFSTMFIASVSNLRLENVNLFEAAPYGGALVGILRPGSTIRNVSVTGEAFADGTAFMGGIAGYCNSATVSESWTRMHVEANDDVGGLIGHAVDCNVERSFSQSRVMSSRYHSFVGGLVGTMYEGSISDSAFSGDVGHGRRFGGLIGTTLDQGVSRSPTITNSFVSGHLMGSGHSRGGILGEGDATVSSTFYAIDTTGVDYTAGTGATAVTLQDLACPHTANDPACLAGLFAGWGGVQNSSGEPAWDFGTNQQVPALRIDGEVLRDSDGDGVFDSEDDFPDDWEASKDSDGDGAIDRWREGCDASCRRNSWLVLDQFPEDPEVARDLDLDGYPEEWNPNCGIVCQDISGFTIDPSPRNCDNDALVDLLDKADCDPSQTTEGDDIDQDSDGLIDIVTLQDLDLARWDPTGASQLDSEIRGEDPNELLRSMTPFVLGDTTGCPPRIVRGTLQRECNGYELMNDLDFDANADGVIDAPFSNGGAGWLGLGRLGDLWYAAFQTNFEGNGHTIYNLQSDRSGFSVGLFQGTRGANIRNVHLRGPDMSIRSTSYPAGGLIGEAEMTTVSNCSSTGTVELSGTSQGGGLIGRAMGGSVQGSFATGEVFSSQSGQVQLGGLLGATEFRTTVSGSFASGLVYGGTPEAVVGGLIGRTQANDLVEASYAIGEVSSADATSQLGGLIASAVEDTLSSHWAVDTSGQSTSAGNAIGVTQNQLACPLGSDDTGCVSGQTLYSTWDEHLGLTGSPLWDFGDSSELPGLCLMGAIHRVNPVDGAPLPTEPCEAFDNGQLTVTLMGQGECRNVHITNNGSSTVNPWKVHFASLNGPIRDIWGGNFHLVGGTVIVTPADYNPSIAPGQTLQDVGFCIQPVSAGQGQGSGAGGLSVTVSNVQDYGYTFCAQYSVTNTSPTNLDPWQATFTFDGNLYDLWGASYSQTGDEVTLSGASWDPDIAAGETLNGGFCGAW